MTKAEPFIRSMRPNSHVSNVIITIDFAVDDALKKKYEHVRFVEYDSNRVRAPNANSCLQHGGFLDALDWVGDEDVIIFTDADIDIQREMSPDEILFFSELADSEIAAGHNASPSQTLMDEAANLQVLTKHETIEASFPGYAALQVYNTGVLAAKKKVYRALYEQYVRDWEKADSLFAHYAKQQWLISYLIQMNFRVKLIPNIIHTHAHYPITLRIAEPCGFKFCIHNQPVLFAHALYHSLYDGSSTPQAIEKTIEFRRLARACRRWKRAAIFLSITLIMLCGLYLVFLLR
ncbi:MAG: hypothetical protein WCJ02_09825 [bacterium]